MFRPGDYLSALMTDGPPAARCELVRSLRSDDFGPRVLARLRSNEQPITVRGMAIADAAWSRAARRLRAVASVQGDQVTPLLAYGRHEGLAYFMYAHDGGPRLTSILQERGDRLPLSTLLPVFGQLLVVVGEAHRKGVVLGGVRPQDLRVLSDRGGALGIRVLDLGLAAVLGVPAGRSNATDHPAIFRAPEPDVTAHPASDVFSLGVLFVRLLTGALPRSSSEAERCELLRARLEQARRDDPSFTDGLFTVLSEVVDADLATRPHDAQRLLESLLEVVPASALRLPTTSDAASLEPTVAEDGAPCWPARQWTVMHEWEQPRRPTPVPGQLAAVPSSETATVGTTTTEPARAATIPPAAPRRRRSSRRGVLGRVGIGAAFVSTVAALALAIAIGEPGAAPSPVSAASLAAVAEPVAPPVAPSHATLVIETTPPGVLTLDGRRIGPTPHEGSLPAGRHVLRVEAPGHETWRASVEVTPGQARRFVVSLEPTPMPAGIEVAMSAVATR